MKVQKGKAADADKAPPTIADLARGSDGLGEAWDAPQIAEGMMRAQMGMMNAMLTSSMAVTSASWNAMAQIWGMGQTKDGDR